MNRWLAPTCTMALVVIIAIMSASPALKNTFHTHGVMHPWLHLVVFALVSFSAMFCSERPLARVTLLLGLMLFGWGTEYREHVVNAMPIERPDVLHDLAGVALGASLGCLIHARPRRKTSLTQ